MYIYTYIYIYIYLYIYIYIYIAGPRDGRGCSVAPAKPPEKGGGALYNTNDNNDNNDNNKIDSNNTM